MNFVSVNDINKIFRVLKPDERERAEALIPLVEDTLRVEAKKVGKNIDSLAEDISYRNVLKSVVIDIVARVLMTSTNREPTTQFAESALGYSISGSFLVPGGGIFIKNTELAKLGLKTQRYGVINFYDEN